MTIVINFYATTEPYGEFSNFSKHHVDLDGKIWPTSEHYFQAQKFNDAAIQEQIRFAKTPMLAANLGRNRKFPLRADWEAVKDSIMREALLAKFTQNNELKALLLSTGTATLVEHTANDFYWADGGDGSGKNMLGKLLMEVREEIAAADLEI